MIGKPKSTDSGAIFVGLRGGPGSKTPSLTDHGSRSRSDTNSDPMINRKIPVSRSA
jgi:hypothetical protein